MERKGGEAREEHEGQDRWSGWRLGIWAARAGTAQKCKKY